MNASPNKPGATFLLRVRLLASVMVVLGGLLAGALALAALFSHQRVVGMAALAVLIGSLIGTVLTEACRARLLWRSGVWIGLGGERLSRDQRPVRFKAWVGTHIFSATIAAVAAGYLSWALFGLRF